MQVMDGVQSRLDQTQKLRSQVRGPPLTEVAKEQAELKQEDETAKKQKIPAWLVRQERDLAGMTTPGAAVAEAAESAASSAVPPPRPGEPGSVWEYVERRLDAIAARAAAGDAEGCGAGPVAEATVPVADSDSARRARVPSRSGDALHRDVDEEYDRAPDAVQGGFWWDVKDVSRL